MSIALQMVDDAEWKPVAMERELSRNIRVLSLITLWQASPPIRLSVVSFMLTVICTSRLRSELSLSFVPPSYDMVPEHEPAEEEDLASVMLSLVIIRQKSLAHFDKLSQDMSLETIFALVKVLEETGNQLKAWRTRLPSRIRFSNMGTQQSDLNPWEVVLEHQFLETCEVTFRPAVYLFLYVLALRPEDDSEETLEALLHKHILDQLFQMCGTHRVNAELRLPDCLRSNSLLVEAGWLRRHSCATLALLLTANTIQGTDSVDLQQRLGRVKELLDNDQLCPRASASYVAMLRRLPLWP